MAVRITADGPAEFVDPLGGLAAIRRRVLDTPAAPEVSFGDDPLRMLRAARFTSQLGFTIAPRVRAGIEQMAPQLGRITAERVAAELDKLVLGEDPVAGIEVMVDTGLGDVVLPEIGAMRLAIDEHHQHKDVYRHSLTVLRQAIGLEEEGPDLVLRWAALLHDIGKPATRKHEPDGGVSFHHHEVVGAKMARKRLRALKYSNQMVDDVSQLVYLHLRFHGYGDGRWTDSAVRRYVTDAGPLLPRLHKLVRADCTTRNKRRAARLQATYDDLESRIAELAAKEDLAAGAAGPRRQRDHGAVGHPGRAGGGPGLAVHEGATAGARPAEQGRRHCRAAGLVERPPEGAGRVNGPGPGGPANACAIVSQRFASAPAATMSSDDAGRRWVTRQQKSSAEPVIRWAASSGPHAQVEPSGARSSTRNGSAGGAWSFTANA